MNMRRDGEWGNWQNAVIAEADGEVAGAAVGYALGEEHQRALRPIAVSWNRFWICSSR